MNACDERDCETILSAALDDKRVAAYFDSTAGNWHTMYTRKDLWGDIHQERLARFLSLADRLCLPLGTKVLEVGCGAGHAAIAVARRGHLVEAIDVAQNMVDLALTNATSAGVAGQVHAAVGDIYSLKFPSGTFSLVLAIGVIPWLSSPGPAIEELGRVLKPGGYLLFTADNRWRLARLLDPATSPVLYLAKKLLKKLFSSPKNSTLGTPGVRSNQHSLKEVDVFLERAGLERLHSETLGFGPFTFFYRKLLPDRFEVAINRVLQHLADLKLPLIGATGAQFLFLVRKRA